jgi:hypothetical protein
MGTDVVMYYGGLTGQFTGTELVFEYDLTGLTNGQAMEVNFSFGSTIGADLYFIVLSECNQYSTKAAYIANATGLRTVTRNFTKGLYYFVFDNKIDAQPVIDFSMNTCTIKDPVLNCTSAIDLSTLCGNMTPTTYDTTGYTNTVANYGNAAYGFPGKEIVFSYTSTEFNETVTGSYYYEGTYGDYLDLIVLNMCSEYEVLGYLWGYDGYDNDFVVTLEKPGTYYFVFDSDDDGVTFDGPFDFVIEQCGLPQPTPTNTVVVPPTATSTIGGPTNTPTITNTPGGPTNTPIVGVSTYSSSSVPAVVFLSLLLILSLAIIRKIK